MIAQVVRVAEDLPGLEKALRLVQNLSTVAVGLSQSKEDAQVWLRAQSQLSVTRRFLRLLKWYPSWNNALAAANSRTDSRKPTLQTALEIGKFSFLGMHFFLEMLVITNASGITTFSWGNRVQYEADRCWFYALAISVLLSLYQILFLTQAVPRVASAEKQGQVNKLQNGKDTGSSTKATPRKLPQTLYEDLVIDGCDLFIPGAALGWIPAGPLFVGTTSTLSAIVAGGQIWRRLQKDAQAEKKVVKSKQS